MKSVSKQPKAQQRRSRALTRLEEQLSKGAKPNPDKTAGQPETVELTEDDVKRIKKEISTLKTRIHGKATN